MLESFSLLCSGEYGFAGIVVLVYVMMVATVLGARKFWCILDIEPAVANAIAQSVTVFLQIEFNLCREILLALVSLIDVQPCINSSIYVHTHFL